MSETKQLRTKGSHASRCSSNARKPELVFWSGEDVRRECIGRAGAAMRYQREGTVYEGNEKVKAVWKEKRWTTKKDIQAQHAKIRGLVKSALRLHLVNLEKKVVLAKKLNEVLELVKE